MTGQWLSWIMRWFGEASVASLTPRLANFSITTQQTYFAYCDCSRIFPDNCKAIGIEERFLF